MTNFNKAKFLWDEHGDFSNRKISRLLVSEARPETPHERSFSKSDGSCTINWPERGPYVVGSLLGKGFISNDVEIESLKEFTKIEDMPAWLNELLSGWIRSKSYLLEDHALNEFQAKHARPIIS